jgi:hypothetical protein
MSWIQLKVYLARPVCRQAGRSGILLLLQKIERIAGINVLRKLNGVLLKFKKGLLFFE